MTTPTEGARGVYKITIGDSLREKQEDNGKDRVFHTFKFGRIPKGTDPEKESKVKVNDQNITMLIPNQPIKGMARPDLRFEGKWEPLQQRDCALIFDPVTKSFVLELVSAAADLKCVRKTVGPHLAKEARDLGRIRTPTPPPGSGARREAQLVEATAEFSKKPPSMANRPVARKGGQLSLLSALNHKSKPKRRLSKAHKEKVKESARTKAFVDTPSGTTKEVVPVKSGPRGPSSTPAVKEDDATASGSDPSSSSDSSSDSSGSDSSSGTSSDEDEADEDDAVEDVQKAKNEAFAELEDDLDILMEGNLEKPTVTTAPKPSAPSLASSTNVSESKTAAVTTGRDGTGSDSEEGDDFIDV